MKYLLFILLSSPIFAADISLMLSPKEKASLEEALKKRAHQNSQTLRLDGIVYHHPSSWTIWLNGQILTPERSQPTLQIIKVTPENVELIWSPNADKHHHIIITLNETFRSLPPDS